MNLQPLMEITEQKLREARIKLIFARHGNHKRWQERKLKIEKDLAWIYNLIMNG